MPRFEDSAAEAAKASEALRALTHSTRNVENPSELHNVLGDALNSVRSLRQTLDQVARAYETHRARAGDDNGDITAGARFIFTASSELHDAAQLLDGVEAGLNVASHASRQITWQPAEASTPRYISVVFLQGEDADRALQMMDELGHVDAIDHLSGWDYGEETTQAALSNGYVYDAPPVAQLDRVVSSGEYTLIANPSYRYVSLLRMYHATPDPSDAPAPAEPPPPSRLPSDSPDLLVSYSSRASAAVARSRTTPQGEQAQGSWFEHPGIAEVKRSRGLER